VGEEVALALLLNSDRRLFISGGAADPNQPLRRSSRVEEWVKREAPVRAGLPKMPGTREGVRIQHPCSSAL
jgi:hypothetical protein